MSDFIANIRAQLDDGGVEARLKALCKDQVIRLKVGDINEGRLQNFLKRRHEVAAQISPAALSSMRSQIENALKNINVTINPTIGSGGPGGKGGVGSVISQDVQKAIDGVSAKRINQWFKIDSKASDQFKTELDKMVEQVAGKNKNPIDINWSTKNVFDKNSGQFIQQLDKAIVKYNTDTGEAITKTMEFNSAAGVWAEVSTKFSKSMETTGKQTDNMQKAMDNFTKLQDRLKQLDSKTNGTPSFSENYGNTKDYQVVIKDLENIKRLESEIEAERQKGDQANFNKMNADLSEMNRLLGEGERKFNALNAPIGVFEGQIASSKVADYANKNTKALAKYGAELKDIQEQMEKATTRGELQDLDARFKNVQGKIKTEGLQGLSFSDEMSRAFRTIGEFTGVYAITKQVFHRIPKEMYNAVKDVDAAMVELRKVSNASDAQLSVTFDKATVSAEKYGVAISDIIKSTADWKRLGYSIEEAEQLADATTLLQQVGDNMSQDSASKALISTLRGFQLDTSEVGRVIDLYNEVANTQPIDTAGLATALERSASSMSAAGNTLEETMAIIASANSVVQDPAAIGTALKTISMRIRGKVMPIKSKDLSTALYKLVA